LKKVVKTDVVVGGSINSINNVIRYNLPLLHCCWSDVTAFGRAIFTSTYQCIVH